MIKHSCFVVLPLLIILQIVSTSLRDSVYYTIFFIPIFFSFSFIQQHEYHKFPRKENGKVVGYHESCTSNVKRNFVSFFEDLSKFSYKDHNMLKTYVYRDGPAFPQAGSTVKRWTFGSTHHSQPNVPVKFVKVRQSSPIGKTNSVLTINFQYYWTFRPAQAFFRPIVCPPRKQKRSVADEIEKELDENFAALL